MIRPLQSVNVHRVIAAVILIAGSVGASSAPAVHAEDGLTVFSDGYTASPLRSMRFDEQNRSYSWVFDGPIGAQIIGFVSPNGTRLTVGTFDGSRQSDPRALIGGGRCSSLPEIEILQADYDADALVRFAARTRLVCDGHPQMTMTAYRATVPLDVPNVDRRTFTSASGYSLTASVGYARSVDVLVQNRGTTVLHPSLRALDPATVPPDVATGLGSCAPGVMPGGSCSLRLTWAPASTGFWFEVPFAIVSEFDDWGDATVTGSAVVAFDLTAGPPPPAGDGIQPMDPVRLLDTRSAVGTPTTTPLTQEVLTVPVAGRAGIPPDATAVVANVTVTDPSIAGYVSVYPSGAEVPEVSNANFVAGQTVANLAVVALGADGAMNVFNGNGTAHVIVDVVGWLSPQEPLVFVPEAAPYRLIDTRESSVGAGTDNRPIGAGETRWINRPIRSAGYQAVLLNITATNATAATYLTAYGGSNPSPNPALRPTASTLNVDAGQTRANLAIVAFGTGARNGIDVYNNAGRTDVVIDVMGTFVPASSPTSTTGRMVAIPPVRAVDTRVTGDAFGPDEAGGYTFPTSIGGQPVAGLVLNATVTQPTAPGFLTLFPGDSTVIPYVSNPNFAGGQTVPNNVWLKLPPAPQNDVGVYNGSSGSSNVLLDIQALILG